MHEVSVRQLNQYWNHHQHTTYFEFEYATRIALMANIEEWTQQSHRYQNGSANFGCGRSLKCYKWSQKNFHHAPIKLQRLTNEEIVEVQFESSVGVWVQCTKMYTRSFQWYHFYALQFNNTPYTSKTWLIPICIKRTITMCSYVVFCFFLFL